VARRAGSPSMRRSFPVCTAGVWATSIVSCLPRWDSRIIDYTTPDIFMRQGLSARARRTNWWRVSWVMGMSRW
jgi:hypothetical protein